MRLTIVLLGCLILTHCDAKYDPNKKLELTCEHGRKLVVLEQTENSISIWCKPAQ